MLVLSLLAVHFAVVRAADYGAGWAWNEPKCGTVSTKHPADVVVTNGRVVGAKGRIVGGSEAAAHSFPWQVWLFIKLDDGRYTTCGATVLNKRWVLTAAHCVDDGTGDPQSSNFLWRMARHLTIYAGIHEQDANKALRKQPMPAADTQQMCGVSKVAIFKDWPGYFKPGVGDDLALLKLDCWLSWSDEVRPACLPDAGMDFNDTSEMMVLTGWGKTGDYDLSSAKLKQLVTKSEGMSYDGRTISLAKGEGGVCGGDSGGPANALRNGRWYVAGVTSLTKGYCNSSWGVSIYTSTNHKDLLDWIHKEIVDWN